MSMPEIRMSPLQVLQGARNIMDSDPEIKIAKALPTACHQVGAPLAPNGYGRAYLALKRAMWGDRYNESTIGAFEQQKGREATLAALDQAIAQLEA